MFIRPARQHNKNCNRKSVHAVYKSTFSRLMKKYMITAIMVVVFSISALSVQPNITYAQSTQTGKSGLPLPRFVSLKSKRVNMRVGPGKEFKVEWMYLKQGLPMEIIQEFDNWRKVRDPQGQEGWILHSLLSGSRTVIITPWNSGESAKRVKLYTQTSESSPVRAEIEPGVVGSVEECSNEWCRIAASDVEGYIQKNTLWGVYPDEIIEN